MTNASDGRQMDVYHSFRLSEPIEEFNALIVGVGGQGTLTLLSLISEAALKDGYEVKGSELHGLAQRYGSIPCFLRIGSGIRSPVFPEGRADLILGLEPLEALNYAVYGSKERTVFVIDPYPIVPISSYIDKKRYPEMDEIKEAISGFSKETILVDASGAAIKETGDRVMANMYMLGYAIGRNLLPLSEESLMETIKESIGPKFIDSNLALLKKGMGDASSATGSP